MASSTLAPPTSRQTRILDFIRTTLQERGYPPSIREIGEAVGLTSPSSVAYQLAQLERRGLIYRDKGCARGIRVAPHTDRTRGPVSAAEAVPEALAWLRGGN